MGAGLLYFACGSNLHPLRLSLRVPAARFQGALALTGYQLRFNKRGRDGSGKGNLLPTGHPDATRVSAKRRSCGNSVRMPWMPVDPRFFR